MEMKKIKDVQELLMDAMTNYVIAEKARVHSDSDFYIGKVQAYITVLGEYGRLRSPWRSLWRKVFVQTF